MEMDTNFICPHKKCLIVILCINAMTLLCQISLLLLRIAGLL